MDSETLPGKKLRKRQTGLQPSTSLDNILAVRHLGLEESDDEDVVFHSLSDSKDFMEWVLPLLRRLSTYHCFQVH
jgi:hypothetical protein